MINKFNFGINSSEQPAYEVPKKFVPATTQIGSPKKVQVKVYRNFVKTSIIYFYHRMKQIQIYLEKTLRRLSQF